MNKVILMGDWHKTGT